MYVKAQYCRNAGLGNKLFPWARGIVLAKKYDYKLIDPIWFSPRGAAITRGGIDYKKALNKIWLYNNFKKRKQDVFFLNGFFLDKKKTRFCDDLPGAIDIIESGEKANIIFKWDSCHQFTDLADHRKLVYESLQEISIDKSLAFVNSFGKAEFIGLNIRTGKDFVRAASGKQGYFLTEIDWFIHALKIVRSTAGNLPALIVSDGGKKELAEILKEPGTELIQSRNAIEDLLVLSKSKLLLGSGNSSFSAWASFLGGMDTFSAVETSFAHFKIKSDRESQIVHTIK